MAKTGIYILAWLTLLAQGLAAQDAGSQIKSEIERLQQSLKEKPLTDPFLSNIVPSIDNALTTSSRELSAGRLYLSLTTLAQAKGLFEGAQRFSSKTEIVNNGGPAFDAEWSKATLELSAFDQKVRKTDWSRTPVAVRALAESAYGKAQPYMEAGRGFAANSDIEDGLFYMGTGKGLADFSVFLHGLALTRQGAPIPLRSFFPELQVLQEKTTAAFKPPQSTDLHPQFIVLNSTIKAARELDSSQLYAGALYQYLEGVRNYGMLDATAPDAAKQERLRNAISETNKANRTSKRDDSIAALFVERANALIYKADGTAPKVDDWKNVQVIVEQVLPAYYAALKPAGPPSRATSRTATLTLVRWPYT